jgi:GNAT superfamily N-acetyltransferase
MRVRAARETDHDAFVAFWAELRLEQPPPARDYWRAHLMPATLFLEDAGGTLAGYGLALPFGARGDVRQIVVMPAFRGRHVGRELMAAVAARLRAAGCTDWRLEVRAANAPAIALYRSVGMRVLQDVHVMRVSRAGLARFAVARSGGHDVVAVDPSDDAALERNLDLGAGQIARWRTIRPHAPLVRVGDTALAQIWWDFLPDCALLWPFRAPDNDVARHLAMRALDVNVARFEIDVTTAELHAALLDVGAEDHEHTLIMGGPLD